MNLLDLLSDVKSSLEKQFLLDFAKILLVKFGGEVRFSKDELMSLKEKADKFAGIDKGEKDSLFFVKLCDPKDDDDEEDKIDQEIKALEKRLAKLKNQKGK